MALGSEDNAALAREVTSQIGPEIDLEYSEPEPAAGVRTSAEQYARFLRKLLVGSPTQLMLGTLLGSDAVCTNPATCTTAIFSPITGSPDARESWHYGLTIGSRTIRSWGTGHSAAPDPMGSTPG